MANKAIYPINLIEDIFGEEKAQAYNVDADKTAGLEYAMDALDERARDILISRYRDKTKTAELTARYGISRSRIHQICRKAFRCLRLPSYCGYIFNGLNGEERRKAKAKEKTFKKEKKNFSNLPFSYMEDYLSVRTINCLKRYAYWELGEVTSLTVGMLDAMTDTELMEIRGLSAKGIENTRNAIKMLKDYYGIID